MARQARDSEYDSGRVFFAPKSTPEWLLFEPDHDRAGNSFQGKVEVDAVPFTTNEEFPKKHPLSDEAKHEYLEALTWDAPVARMIYERALLGDELEQPMLQEINVRFKEATVWWVEFDKEGTALEMLRPATLYDLVEMEVTKSHGWVRDGRKKDVRPWKRTDSNKKVKRAYLLSIEQFEKAEYPPESKGGPPFSPLSVARERGRKR